MKKTKGKKKLLLIIPLIILLVLAISFIGWIVKPAKKMNIAVLDTTVPATDGQGVNQTDRYYRKHSGFFWLLNQQKYVKSNGKKYNYKKDYFGPQINENGEYTGENQLADFDKVPDFLYLADVYGSELYDNKYSGLSSKDMNIVSLTYSTGGTVVAETELLGSTTDETVCNEIKSMFGFTTTSWSGRYVVDLNDFSDVPKWAPSTYENQYGVKWQFSGPGLILASSEGGIIVLEEKTDFKSKNLVSISISDEFKKEFSGSKKSNFYNWFELVEAENGTDTIANFKINVNATGMEKIKEISSTNKFAAIIRKRSNNSGDTYYFAGDFNDCTSDSRIYRFLAADKFFKALSFDKEGDINQFYWKFYNPLMKKILKDTYKGLDEKNEKQSENEKQLTVRVNENKFQIKKNDDYENLNLKAVNVNLDEPGSANATRNYGYYKELLEQAVEMGVNTVRVYELAPPEFYRALFEINQNSDDKLYLIQTIKGMVADTQEEWQKTIDTIMSSIHGNGETKNDSTDEGQEDILKYRHDVSEYLLSYVLDISPSGEELQTLSNQGETYDGNYVSSMEGIGSLYAKRLDYIYKKCSENYGGLVPVGMHVNVENLESAFWNEDNYNGVVKLSSLQLNQDVQQYYYVSTKLNVTDNILNNNLNKFVGFTDSQGNFNYGSYVEYVKEKVSPYGLMIDGFGISTNANIYATNGIYSGLDETQQGEIIVRMLDAILTNGCMGGIISDLNDSWSAVSDEAKASIVPLTNNPLWHDLGDPAQTTGILAVKAEEKEDVGLELKDFEVMRKMQLSVNPEYLYVTVALEKEIDYTANELIVGLDTYERNNGEYFYNKGYFANSLSGMEYIIKITSAKDAALYVCSSYARGQETVSSTESYDGKWTKVMDLTYGNFSTSTSQFFIGSTNVRIRIPWTALNVTDPSQRVVIEQKTPFDGIQYKTTITNGFIPSLFVGNRESGDTEYIFPLSKDAVGYKTYKYETWKEVDYTVERKGSFGTIQAYLKSYN